jgi:hypothetical protein
VSASDGWGRANSGGGRSEGARAEMGRLGREEGGTRARRREVVVPDSAQPRGRRFSFFFFYFHFYFYFHFFYLLFLLNKYLAIYS